MNSAKVRNGLHDYFQRYRIRMLSAAETGINHKTAVPNRLCQDDLTRQYNMSGLRGGSEQSKTRKVLSKYYPSEVDKNARGLEVIEGIERMNDPILFMPRMTSLLTKNILDQAVKEEIIAILMLLQKSKSKKARQISSIDSKTGLNSLVLCCFNKNNQMEYLGQDQSKTNFENYNLLKLRVEKRTSMFDFTVSSICRISDELIAISGSHGEICLLDTESKTFVDKLEQHKTEIVSMKSSYDQRYLVSCDTDGFLKIWDVANRQIVHEIEENPGTIQSFSISSEGIFCAYAYDSYEFKVIELETGKLVHAFANLPSIIEQVVFSRDYLISGDRHGNIVIWDWDKEIRFTINGFMQSGVLEAHNDLLIHAGFRIEAFDTNTGKNIHNSPFFNLNFTCVKISSNGKYIASSDISGCIFIWDSSNMQLIKMLYGHTEGLCSIEFTDNLLISTSSDGRLIFWKLDGNYQFSKYALYNFYRGFS